MAETKLAETDPALPLYERDFHEWTEYMTAVLRKRDAGALDWEHLAEAIESLGGRDRRELKSRLTVLIAHLLKWQHQPDLRPVSTWSATIFERRIQFAGLIEQSPSLKAQIREAWPKVYRRAAAYALREMKAPIPLPRTCPYTQEQVLDFEFYPD